jgi:hypothetical protein
LSGITFASHLDDRSTGWFKRSVYSSEPRPVMDSSVLDKCQITFDLVCNLHFHFIKYR